MGATPGAGDESDDDSHGGFDLGFDDGAWSDGSDFDADALFGAGPGDAMFGQGTSSLSFGWGAEGQYG